MNLATNKKAQFDYHILESFQAGLSLSGKMVKQLRKYRVNITGKYVIFQKSQLQIIDFGNDQIRQNVPLLLSKKEMNEIRTKLNEKGISCVVLNIRTLDRWIKAEIAIVQGKKNYDKREDIKKRDLDREQARSDI